MEWYLPAQSWLRWGQIDPERIDAVLCNRFFVLIAAESNSPQQDESVAHALQGGVISKLLDRIPDLRCWHGDFRYRSGSLV